MLIDLTSAERAAISLLEYAPALRLQPRWPTVTVIVRPRTGDDTLGLVINMRLTIIGAWCWRSMVFCRRPPRRQPTDYPDKDVYECWG